MGKKSEKPNAAANPQEIDRIEAVKNLIFGENIKQYNNEFADVYDKIKDLKSNTEKNLEHSVASLESKLADLESLMENKFQDLNNDLDKRLEELDDAKSDRRKLGKALEKIALMLQE